jgi:hypothetical protein
MIKAKAPFSLSRKSRGRARRPRVKSGEVRQTDQLDGIHPLILGLD